MKGHEQQVNYTSINSLLVLLGFLPLVQTAALGDTTRLIKKSSSLEYWSDNDTPIYANIINSNLLTLLINFFAPLTSWDRFIFRKSREGVACVTSWETREGILRRAVIRRSRAGILDWIKHGGFRSVIIVHCWLGNYIVSGGRWWNRFGILLLLRWTETRTLSGIPTTHRSV